MLRTHRAGKCLGGCGGWGLDSRNRRGPGVPPTPGLRGRSTSPGSPAGSPCPNGQGNHPLLLSCSSCRAPPTGLLPPVSSDLLGLPPMPPGPTQPGGGLEGRGSAWELSRLPSPSGPGGCPLLLSCSSRRVPPTCLS